MVKYLASKTLTAGVCTTQCRGSFQLRENKKLFGRVYGSRVTGRGLSVDTNIEIYDLAGQSEYYSSHAAMLESLCLESPAVFVMMVDLTKSEEQLSKEIYNWSNFLEVQGSSISSRVIVVGSRKDKFSSKPQLLTSKCKYVEDTAKDALEKQCFAGFVALDSRQLSFENIQPFLSTLTRSIDDLTISGVDKKMSFACHLLHMFLNEIVKIKAISFHSLQKLISHDRTLSALADPASLTSNLGILADKGLILFLRSSNHFSSSCIVIDKTRLLQEINGTLFAPTFFKEHRPIASNTGIAPLSLLHQIFPHYDRDILVALMTSLQFCRPVDPALLFNITTNLSPESSTSEQLLYFPALVSAERPSNLSISEGFGWCVYCTNPHKSLTRRCQDALMLDLAYNFCLSIPTPPKLEHPNEAVVHKLNRSCTVWKNGIHWITSNGTQAMVQVTEESRCVSFSFSLDREHLVSSLKLCSSVINMILSKLKELCPSIDISEYLISSTQIPQICHNSLSQLTVFEMKDVARSILFKESFVFDVSRKERINPASLLFFEPYQVLPLTVVKQLFACNNSSEPVQASLLREICHHIKEMSIPENSTHKSVQEQLNKMSVFAGRNPLELAGATAADLLDSPLPDDVEATPTSSISPAVLNTNKVGDATFINCSIGAVVATGGIIGTNISQLHSPSKTGDDAIPSPQAASPPAKSGSGGTNANQPPPPPLFTSTDSLPEALDPSHLHIIRRYLHDLTDWQGLGLEIGLDFPALESIDERKSGNVKKCKTAMLHSWLQTGSATKTSLVAALRALGEDAAAAKIQNLFNPRMVQPPLIN